MSSFHRCKEQNETSVSVVIESDRAKLRTNNNLTIKCNDNETSISESNVKSSDNNNEDWRNRDKNLLSPETSQGSRAPPVKVQRRATVAFREPCGRKKDRDNGTTFTRLRLEEAATTDCQDSSDTATTADERPKEILNGHGRRRCFTRLKSASTSRLNYSPKRGEGWCSPLESLRQQLRKLDDLEDQFPDLACQPAYSLRYPFAELGAVSAADTPELEFVRHRALVEREGMRRARAALRRRRAALRETREDISPHRAPSEEREATELEVALHRARALLGEKEIRLKHIERALRRLAAPALQPPIAQICNVCSIVLIPQKRPRAILKYAKDLEWSYLLAILMLGRNNERRVVTHSSGHAADPAASGAVLRSLRALHADVRDIWLALDARRPATVSPETSSCNAASTSQPRHTVSAEATRPNDATAASVAERARGLRAWLQTAP
ncbi:hypothetical protein EVAR_92403_1 [Eumeta japonica]|uniref:Uncharacterized protein n=1 Tax=Eumeta variegata TaxID=151549 RepID=A0A4C1TM07_EUMVA|nr:hypothetical protein EVAR_92403_1 [Eumeta japonica]